MNLMSKTPRLELLLHPREMLKLDNNHPRMAIECRQGVLWVTSSGDLDDHVLSAGQRFIPGRKSKVIIEAIQDACVDIEEQ